MLTLPKGEDKTNLGIKSPDGRVQHGWLLFASAARHGDVIALHRVCQEFSAKS